MTMTPQPRILDLSNPADRALARRTIRFAWRTSFSTVITVGALVLVITAIAAVLPLMPVSIGMIVVTGLLTWLVFPHIVAGVMVRPRDGRRMYAVETEVGSSVVALEPASYRWAPTTAVRFSTFASRPKGAGLGLPLVTTIRDQELAAGRPIAAYALRPLSRVYAHHDFPIVGSLIPGLLYRHLLKP